LLSAACVRLLADCRQGLEEGPALRRCAALAVMVSAGLLSPREALQQAPRGWSGRAILFSPGESARAVALAMLDRLPPVFGVAAVEDVFGHSSWAAKAPLADWDQQAPLVRDVLGDIFRSGRYEDLPVLADALEETGCRHQALLTHLRLPLLTFPCLLCNGAGQITGKGPDRIGIVSATRGEPCPGCRGRGSLEVTRHGPGCWATELLAFGPGYLMR
jgi:hypothetical protein